MLPVPNESSPTAPNNPAARVRERLLDFQATMPTVEDNAMLVVMKMLDEPQESARIYHSMTELRLQAESVPRLMAQYAGMPGYQLGSLSQRFADAMAQAPELRLAVSA
jgi:hypothetical protein